MVVIDESGSIQDADVFQVMGPLLNMKILCVLLKDHKSFTYWKGATLMQTTNLKSSIKSKKYVLKEVPKSVVCKMEDDAIPLPDPFSAAQIPQS